MVPHPHACFARSNRKVWRVLANNRVSRVNEMHHKPHLLGFSILLLTRRAMSPMIMTRPCSASDSMDVANDLHTMILHSPDSKPPLQSRLPRARLSTSIASWGLESPPGTAGAGVAWRMHGRNTGHTALSFALLHPMEAPD
jgi:hypothetical protein